MKKYLKYIPYYLVIFFFYWPLIDYSHYSSQVTLYTEGDCTLTTYHPSFHLWQPSSYPFFAFRFHFSVWWLLGIGLLLLLTIITFGEFILLYLVAYELFALLGMASGVDYQASLPAREK